MQLMLFCFLVCCLAPSILSHIMQLMCCSAFWSAAVLYIAGCATVLAALRV